MTIDAICDLVDGGIKWRSMPVDFPCWKRVYAFFSRRRENQLVKEFHDRLRDRTRAHAGRNAGPSAAIIDARSVEAAANVPAASRGFDGGKLINGRHGTWSPTLSAWSRTCWSARRARVRGMPSGSCCPSCGPASPA
ncbi:hypothetical protein [Streptomyces sp. NBC_01716]|uniref:hypothetical protein n=1 Tax=Streptomyces sp. NBC_01716 TaxID=2975917 RepID=UPI002E375FD3|nr:hypothetical protein [Streptomyces sp. NBC_01716]